MNLSPAKITPWRNNAKAALSLSFDGAYAVTYESAMKALIKNQMPATWFVVTGYVNDKLEGRAVARWSDLKEASSYGMEIASHSVTHPFLYLPYTLEFLKYLRRNIRTIWKLVMPSKAVMAGAAVFKSYRRNIHGVTSNDVIVEAIESKKMIEEQISGEHVLSFAYPGGRYDSPLKDRLKKAGYLSARSTDDGYNFLDSIDLYALKSKTWNVSVNAEKANRWVDYAVEKGAWLIETYHVISQDGASAYYYYTSLADFDIHLRHVASKDIWIDTQQSIVRYIKQREATEIRTNVVSNDKLVLSVDNRLDPSIYNQILTLKISVPNTWKGVRIMQGSEVWEMPTAKEGRNRYIYYNTLPNRGDLAITSL